MTTYVSGMKLKCLKNEVLLGVFHVGSDKVLMTLRRGHEWNMLAEWSTRIHIGKPNDIHIFFCIQKYIRTMVVLVFSSTRGEGRGRRRKHYKMAEFECASFCE